MKKHVGAIAAATALALSLSACASTSAEATGELDYWLWDANQLPAYEQCAVDFTKANPDIKVKITQRGYGDYWTTLTNGFVAGNAPDVFVNHLSKYPEFAEKDQLMPLDDAVEENAIDLDIYNEGLADLWVGQDGKRYGLPKDWDTVAMFYNKTFIEDAGYTEDDLANLDWNPEDGGSYEATIAHLTVDKNGTRGDEAGFDKNQVAVYGLGLESSGTGQGQTQWSFLTGTTGWTHTDENPWGTKFNYDDPRFQDTIDWWAGLSDKGFMPKLETTVGASVSDTFGAGKAAINTQGSWMIGQYTSYKGIDVGIAPTPIGPDGERASMFNGLADSIYAGTKNPEAAVKWVEYLASTDCQDVVADKGVVFPAITSSSERAAAAFESKGIDVSAFTTHVEDGTTVLFPITDNAAKVEGLMGPAMDAVLAGQKDAGSLTEVNEKVNGLFK